MSDLNDLIGTKLLTIGDDLIGTKLLTRGVGYFIGHVEWLLWLSNRVEQYQWYKWVEQ